MLSPICIVVLIVSSNRHTDIGVLYVLMMALQTDVLLSLKSMQQKTLALWWFIKKMVDSLMLEMKVWLSLMLSM